MNLLQMNTCDLTGNGRRQDVLGARTLFWNGLQTGVKQTTQMQKIRCDWFCIGENIFQHVPRKFLRLRIVSLLSGQLVFVG